ncbi:response regulator [Variovorax sp. JS1663]|uniref:response regulator n=1 Tax=Variovorax sp. JS1663 TaxID=1851577 RepID=UPI000B34769C|nr:response regulator [Variovorax sp. JS1663]OUM02843.1 hypothetical protein A8M77_09615 [Variovorax sp. JS1663]
MAYGDAEVSDKGHVVIVETDDLIHELLERWFTAEGFTVGADGAPPARVVLVVVNVSRPGQVDPTLEALRARYQPAPILAISARFRRGLAASVEAAARLGVQKILPKPFTREELRLAVEEALGAVP